jgi:hypothetical protein
MRTTRAGLLLVILTATSCCTGSCPTELLLRGEAPATVSGPGADDPAVAAALAELMTLRVYDNGAYMEWCCNRHDRSKLANGAADTYVTDNGERATGTATRGSGRYVLEFALPQGQLSVDMDFNAAQGLIYQIKMQRGGAVGERMIVADCAFDGVLAGKQVALEFQQDIRAVGSRGYHSGWY